MEDDNNVCGGEGLTWFALPAAVRGQEERTSQQTSGWCVSVLCGAGKVHNDNTTLLFACLLGAGR